MLLVSSVERPRLMRAVERKSRDRDREAFAGRQFHLVASDHDARRRRERRAAGVFEALAGTEHRLLADDAGAAHVLDTAHRVGKSPMPSAQLHGFAALIFDADVIGPDIAIL